MKYVLRCLALLSLLLSSAPACASASSTALPRTQLLRVMEGTIAYDDTGGNGPVVIALPGIGDLRGQYRFLRPQLQRAGIRLITMDPRGQGASSVGWPEYTARASARDILDLIEKLQVRNVVLIGNSFSAGAVLLAAHQAPAIISGTVLIGPVVRDEPSSWLMDAAIKLAFASPWATSLWTRYWDSLFPVRKPSDHDAYRRSLHTNLTEPGRMEVLRKLIALPKSEANNVIERLSVPALVVMGSKDADFESPEQTAHALASRLGSRPLIVSGAGHYPHVEFPELVGPHIVSFVQRASFNARVTRSQAASAPRAEPAYSPSRRASAS